MFLIKSLGIQSRPGAVLLPRALMTRRTSTFVIAVVKELHCACESLGMLFMALALSVLLMEVEEVGVLE